LEPVPSQHATLPWARTRSTSSPRRIELYPELRTFDGPAWVDRALGLRRRSEVMVAEGSLDGDAVQSLWNDLQIRHGAGRFFMAIPFVVASATR
jgi:hypothetical protein